MFIDRDYIGDGRKLYRVDNIRDGELLVDDRPYKTNQ